jgi:hypothetical protein
MYLRTFKLTERLLGGSSVSLRGLAATGGEPRGVLASGVYTPFAL